LSSEVGCKGQAAESRRNLSRVIAGSIIASLLWGNRASSLLNRRDWWRHTRVRVAIQRRGRSPPPVHPSGRKVTRRMHRPGCTPTLPTAHKRPPSTRSRRRFFQAPPRRVNLQRAPAGYATAAAVTLTIITSLPILPPPGGVGAL
jgi:hypothetical protein